MQRDRSSPIDWNTTRTNGKPLVLAVRSFAEPQRPAVKIGMAPGTDLLQFILSAGSVT
jgi:hypothetical protein